MYCATLALFAFLWVADAVPVQQRSAQKTVPLTRHFNAIPASGAFDLAKQAQDRARYLNSKSDPSARLSTRETSTSMTDIIFYETINVGVGSPETTYDILVDSGSSNTWVGALGSGYAPTSTSYDTGDQLYAYYGGGNPPSAYVYGEQYYDRVDLGSGLIINNQSIGVANQTAGFYDFEGILGIGPDTLTAGSLWTRGYQMQLSKVVPTVTDSLYAEGTISERVVGIYFPPPTTDNEVDGELTFGGFDTSRMTSSVTYTSTTSTNPSSLFWGLNATISYGSQQLLSAAGIVDTGTPGIVLASDTFAAYQAAIPGAQIDNEYTGLLEIPADSLAGMQPLLYNLGGVTLEVSPSAQLFPWELYSYIGGQAGSNYSVVMSSGQASGSGLDFVIGKFMLEHFYTVLDTTNSRIGFATTAYT